MESLQVLGIKVQGIPTSIICGHRFIVGDHARNEVKCSCPKILKEPEDCSIYESPMKPDSYVSYIRNGHLATKVTQGVTDRLDWMLVLYVHQDLQGAAAR